MTLPRTPLLFVSALTLSASVASAEPVYFGAIDLGVAGMYPSGNAMNESGGPESEPASYEAGLLSGEFGGSLDNGLTAALLYLDQITPMSATPPMGTTPMTARPAPAVNC